MRNIYEMFNNLPASWSTADLGDLLERITNGMNANQSKVPVGIPISRIETISQGVVNFERVQYVIDVDEKKFEHFSLKKGDILFSHINSDLHLGKTAVFQSDKPLLHGINLLLLRTKSNLLDPKYLHYILNLYRASGLFMAIAQHAVNQSSLNQAKIKSLKIPLPPRIEDQQQIVAEIEKQFSRLDESVTALKRIQANLKRYKAAVLKAAVEGKLTEQWRKEHPDVEPADQLLKRILAERRAKWEVEELAKMNAKGIKPKDDSWKKKYKESAGPDTANLPELPGGWVWGRSDQLFSFVTSGSRGWASYYSETGPVFLRMGNLDHDTIRLDLTDIQRVQPPEGSEGSRTRVCAGDILVSITADVGMVGMVPEGFEEAYINQHVALARPLTVINCPFLAWYFASKSGQDQFKDLQRGATKVGLGLDDIKSVNVPIPSVKEQQAILEEIDRRLSVTEELEATIETSLKRADRLRQTILKQAFSDGFGGS